MKHLFVPHELALQLKEKGFDEPCLMFYYNDGNGLTDDGIFKTGTDSNPCNAPLYQQVMDWLVEKHGIYIELLIDGWGDDKSVSNENIGYRAYIWQVGKPKPQPNDDLGMSSYQNILNIAIKNALKLI